jgi:hypothetical protein
VKTSESSESDRPAVNHAKPTAHISAPKRLWGRRSQAKRPVPTNEMPMNAPRTAVTASSRARSEPVMTATSAAAKTTARRAIPSRARRSEVTAS